jgi:alpha-1,3-rhamnosyltransferase
MSTSVPSSEHNLPLVSVIIASYNHAPYIEASIDSVLRQTYPHIELLVIDDGSSDGSVELLRDLQTRHGFDLHIQPNQGLPRTLNESIARARGDLIAPFGSDDIMMPWRIEHQVAYLSDKPEVGICAGNVEVIDSQGQIAEERKQRYRNRPFRRMDFGEIFYNRGPGLLPATFMFRKSVLVEVGGFDPNIRLEDFYIELAITHAGYFIDVLGEVLAQYRQHSSNTYKNHRFMVDNVLKTYARFSDHPDHAKACACYRNSMFLKCARQDKPLARELLAELPMSAWNMKTLRGLWRLGLWYLLRHA